jgi:putative holliday junction resolvase
MRLLGVDFGFKRIGLAVMSTDSKLPALRQPIEAAGSLRRDAERLADIARREAAEAVVIGLPLETDGQEGRMARVCRSLGVELEKAGLEVFMVDETLTSVAAEEAMIASGLKASERRKRRDGEAAARILERYLLEADS